MLDFIKKYFKARKAKKKDKKNKPENLAPQGVPNKGHEEKNEESIAVSSNLSKCSSIESKADRNTKFCINCPYLLAGKIPVCTECPNCKSTLEISKKENKPRDNKCVSVLAREIAPQKRKDSIMSCASITSDELLIAEQFPNLPSEEALSIARIIYLQQKETEKLKAQYEETQSKIKKLDGYEGEVKRLKQVIREKEEVKNNYIAELKILRGETDDPTRKSNFKY